MLGPSSRFFAIASLKWPGERQRPFDRSSFCTPVEIVRIESCAKRCRRIQSNLSRRVLIRSRSRSDILCQNTHQNRRPFIHRPRTDPCSRERENTARGVFFSSSFLLAFRGQDTYIAKRYIRWSLLGSKAFCRRARGRGHARARHGRAVRGAFLARVARRLPGRFASGGRARGGAGGAFERRSAASSPRYTSSF